MQHSSNFRHHTLYNQNLNMKNLTLFLFCLSILFVGVACDDNDDNNSIGFYTFDLNPKKINEITTNTRSIGTSILFVSIKGGDGNYKFTSSDQEVIEDSSIEVSPIESYDYRDLHFIVLKEGECVITVTDGLGNMAKLKVVIKTAIDKYEISETELIINNKVSKEIKAEIEADIKLTNLITNNFITMKYTESGKGLFAVSSTPDSEDIRFGGPFRFEHLENVTSLYLTYNDIEHRYNHIRETRSTTKTSIMEIPPYEKYIEDVTEFYKTKYPSENITDVSYVLVFYRW